MAKIDKYKSRNKERDARRNKKSFLKHLGWAIINPDNIQNTLLAIFTAGLIIVGVLQKWTLDAQKTVLEKTDQTLQIEQRAWIAPRLPEIIGKIDIGQTLTVDRIYSNTGKEPALNISDDQNIIVVKTPRDGKGVAYWGDKKFPENKTCPRPFPDGVIIQANERSAFVGSDYRDPFYIWPNTGTPKAFVDREVTFIVQGCIVYETLGKLHFSAYCAFLDQRKDAAPIEWKFRFCPNGNYTDEYQPKNADNILNKRIIDLPIISRETSPTTVPLEQLR